MAPSLSLPLSIAVAVRLLHHFLRESLLCCQFPDRAVWAQRVPLSGGPSWSRAVDGDPSVSRRCALGPVCLSAISCGCSCGDTECLIMYLVGWKVHFTQILKNNSVFTRSARGVSDQAHVWFKRPSQLFFFFLLSYAQFLLFHMRLWFFLSVIFPPVWSWHHQHLLVCRIRALVEHRTLWTVLQRRFLLLKWVIKARKHQFWY